MRLTLGYIWSDILDYCSAVFIGHRYCINSGGNLTFIVSAMGIIVFYFVVLFLESYFLFRFLLHM